LPYLQAEIAGPYGEYFPAMPRQSVDRAKGMGRAGKKIGGAEAPPM